ncbi:MAG: alpha amylase C-terminal domain-containing protein, partial [Gemmatimonadaceae bacterium]|nr:alpha amylase C-terminal domain-containing protein [Gemmatimonadaceae bacterium]
VRYRLAMTWLLGQPYGYPSIYSGYAFNRGSTAGNDMGPPSDAQGNTQPVRCAAAREAITVGDRTCEHRDPALRAMVAFRKAVAGTDASRQWTDGANAVAYSRGDRGFVAINANEARLDAAIPTGLAAGTYCDVLTGGRAGTTCAGTAVVVSAGGIATVALPAGTALAIHSATRL